MKKVLTLIIILLIIVLAVLGALFFQKTPAKEADVSKPAQNEEPSGDKPSQSEVDPPEHTDPEPVKPETKPDEPEKPEVKEPTSNREAKAQLSFSVEGTDEPFECSLFVSDFGLPEAHVVYSIYYDDTGLTYERYDNTDIFRSQYGAEMDISLHRGVTSEELSPSFMDSCIDFTDIEFNGVTTLGKTGLKGYMIDAYNRKDCARAYLIDHEGDVISVVLHYTFEMGEGWFPRMISMFNSFEFEYLY